MKEELISVIVPVYNVQNYLKKCIQSIINQTYKNIEIILVNDGSTDDSGLICEKFSDVDSRISVVHKTNGGLSDARNVGIKMAHGKYIGFVDGDDYIDKLMYEKLINKMERSNADIAICGRCRIKEKAKRGKNVFKNKKTYVLDKETAFKKFLTRKYFDSSACDKLFKRALFKDIKFPLGCTQEDILTFYKLLEKSKKVILLKEVLYFYVIRKGSITCTNGNFSKNKLSIYSKYMKVSLFVKERYPSIIKERECFECYALLEIILIMLKSNGDITSKNEFQYFKNLLKENIRKFLFNRYFPLSKKILSIIIVNNISFVYKIIF